MKRVYNVLCLKKFCYFKIWQKKIRRTTIIIEGPVESFTRRPTVDFYKCNTLVCTHTLIQAYKISENYKISSFKRTTRTKLFKFIIIVNFKIEIKIVISRQFSRICQTNDAFIIQFASFTLHVYLNNYLYIICTQIIFIYKRKLLALMFVKMFWTSWIVIRL